MSASRPARHNVANDEAHVPVTMGARDAREHEFGPWHLIDARFPAGERLERHTHERVTFAVMLAGSFDLLIGGKRLSCLPGTVFTEPAGEVHANAIGSGGAHVLVMQPDPAAEFPRTCAHLLDRVSHFDSAAIARLGRRMARELSRPDDLTPLECQALALEMLARAGRLEQARVRSGNAPAWLERVASLIHDRFREPVSIDDLASEAGVHPAHLTRVFRDRYGTSPGQYVRRLRLEWAAERLCSGKEPLSRVALQAGFADQAHFTSAFKRHWGLPPGRYRALRRGSRHVE
ncbi:MAG TPA: AraC family transcriptional regulator [Longimicrobiales bacterium]|nr:AraC family transcriptional regulator [Longimicrobiales bacterium]